MASRLSDCLVHEGTLPVDVVRAATARQAVYGGALDTALLELGALDESTLWSALASATGEPHSPDAALFENPDPTAAAVCRLQRGPAAAALGVPVGQRGGERIQFAAASP